MQFKCSQTLHQTSLCSFRRWPTFSQSGASKWSSHTLNGWDYATNSGNALWLWCFTPEKCRPAAMSSFGGHICSKTSFSVFWQKKPEEEKYPGKLQIRCSSLQRQESVFLFLAVCRHGNPCSRKLLPSNNHFINWAKALS